MSRTYRKQEVAFCVKCDRPRGQHTREQFHTCECSYLVTETLYHADGSVSRVERFRPPETYYRMVEVHDCSPSMTRSRKSGGRRNRRADHKFHYWGSHRAAERAALAQIQRQQPECQTCECEHMFGETCRECREVLFPVIKHDVLYELT